MIRMWLFCLAVVLCVAASSAADTPWWKNALLYQVYPRSFKDSNGDGLGDLKGVTQMAEYFQELGMDAVWLTPVFTTPMADFGYDISNFTDIDPLFGTMADFDALLAKLKSLGLKLLLDFVPNHSSDEHPWFLASMNTSHPRHADYKDFYVWKDPIGWTNDSIPMPIPPNNWKSVFGGSSWQWVADRQQFYYHAFKVKQPDLNYRNPLVVGNMTAIMNFWFDKGIDGFRVDAVQWMYENISLPDDPPTPGTDGDSFFTLLHPYDMNQPESFDLLHYWADMVYNRSKQDGQDRVLMLEAMDRLDILMQYYGTGTRDLEFPFNFYFIFLVDQSKNSSVYAQIINSYLEAKPPGGTPNWVIGNHDQGRVAKRYGTEMVDAMNLLSGVLPGVKTCYYGEEIGMENTYIRPDQELDPVFLMDAVRTPMQWDGSVSSGFSSNPKTWLPVNPNYWWLNVAAQRQAASSHLKVFQAMAQARKEPVLLKGDLTVMTPDNDTLVVVRYYNDTYMILVMNTGSQTLSLTSAGFFSPNKLDMDLTVVVGSTNSGCQPGLSLRQMFISLTLRPKAAVLLRSSTPLSPDNYTSSAVTPGLSTAAALCILMAALLPR